MSRMLIIGKVIPAQAGTSPTTVVPAQAGIS